MTGMMGRVVLLSFALFAGVGLARATTVVAQENPPPKPVAIPCAADVSAQVLGTSPVGDGSQTLVLARVIFAPGGSLGAHTHPGTIVATVESGVLGFTLLDAGAMSITRAATDGTPAAQEPLTVDQETTLDPGDGFVEMGMVHSARSIGDEPAVVLISGLIETGQPLTQCVEGEGTPASTAHG